MTTRTGVSIDQLIHAIPVSRYVAAAIMMVVVQGTSSVESSIYTVQLHGHMMYIHCDRCKSMVRQCAHFFTLIGSLHATHVDSMF